MKIIHLLRHAKSSRADPSVADIDRPLNTRGKHATLLMIEPIWKAGCRFENVYCSPARRARSTIRRMSKALRRDGVKWVVDEALYTFDAGDLQRWLQHLDDAMEEVMVVGHNPAMTDLVNALGDQPIENVPTCGYVQLRAYVDNWRDIKESCAEVAEFVYPKMFDIQE